MNASDVVAMHRARIRSLLPDATVELTGSALVPELAADDVDLVVLVDDVETATAALRSTYEPLYPAEWRPDWAAFREPGAPVVDVVVTVPGSKGDAHHRRVWQRLAHDAALLDEYKRLKQSRDADYAARKAAFFERLVAGLDA